MATAVFTLFPNLPPELRNQIWRDTLPDKVRQALYFYKRGCWRTRRLTEDDEDYSHDNDQLNICHEFRHDLLDPMKFEVPLLFVNSEARGVALTWMQGQGLKIRFCEDRQNPIVIRSFDPDHDTLYISLKTWDDFSNEPYEIVFPPDHGSGYYNCAPPAFTRIAVPEAFFQHDIPLSDLFHFYCSLEKVFIIPDAQSDIQSEMNDLKMQRRWELQSTQGPMLFWNNDRDCFEWKHNAGDSNNAMNSVIEKACDGLDEALEFYEMKSFEVRAVYAVRK
ncbi:hypothetical protein F9C07_8145 [Aspergillus flavus]|uniref:2EXR domain-containing protein n=1 Tax=Aspergillus flavus (strain ATCC 200026 / FGSC A1120 / IAM 13836 / NRRL 3357 / JCM 12722 / SRRC 167) TaxID=332952 RepID=A0A7U2N1A0_ASPFN|nr:uncharacterized protein G4B84_009978 [Aspergillus flavus NRRL3357]KAF7622111.1 hypothetical protein AFLA_008658 [Aspergillus flavus NRRL3357]QMW34512.1 hypothetical protein G4B84_009978 [Aspergillus flavus NRRL3357]QRD93697.1 hypothetical protein F9C07_8145 [Aspergillus flavus]